MNEAVFQEFVHTLFSHPANRKKYFFSGKRKKILQKQKKDIKKIFFLKKTA